MAMRCILRRSGRRDDPQGDELRRLWDELERRARILRAEGVELPEGWADLLERREATLEAMRSEASRAALSH